MLRAKVRLSFLPHKKRLRGIGRSQEQVKLTLRLLGERALHIANTLTLPFYLLPFYLLRWRAFSGAGEAHISVTGRERAHCKSLDFTFLPFEDREGTEDLEEGNSHFGYWEGREHCTLQIA